MTTLPEPTPVPRLLVFTSEATRVSAWIQRRRTAVEELCAVKIEYRARVAEVDVERAVVSRRVENDVRNRDDGR